MSAEKLEEFAKRYAALEERLKQEGMSDSLRSEFEVIYEDVGLQIVLGPTALAPGGQSRLWPTDVDASFYAQMFEEGNGKELAPLFSHERWGAATLRLSSSTLDGNVCPAIRVKWAAPIELLAEYERPDTHRQIEGMIATICLMNAVVWSKWRIELLEANTNSSSTAFLDGPQLA